MTVSNKRFSKLTILSITILDSFKTYLIRKSKIFGIECVLRSRACSLREIKMH